MECPTSTLVKNFHLCSTHKFFFLSEQNTIRYPTERWVYLSRLKIQVMRYENDLAFISCIQHKRSSKWWHSRKTLSVTGKVFSFLLISAGSLLSEWVFELSTAAEQSTRISLFSSISTVDLSRALKNSTQLGNDRRFTSVHGTLLNNGSADFSKAWQNIEARFLWTNWNKNMKWRHISVTLSF